MADKQDNTGSAGKGDRLSAEDAKLLIKAIEEVEKLEAEQQERMQERSQPDRKAA